MTCRSFVVVALLALGVVSCGGGSRQLPTGPGPIITPPVVDPPVTPVPPTLTVTKIMAFGDSLTEGESLGQLLVPTADPSTPGVSTSYPYKLQTTLTTTYTAQTIRVFNAGRGGERAVGSAKDRLIQMITTFQPEVVLLLHGVNDVNGATSLTELTPILDAVEEMVEIAHARGAHVVLANLPPQIPTSKATGGERLQQFNAVLPSIAAEEGATFVDLYSGITASSTMLMPDGLHLTEAGNVKVAELFYAALKAKYHKAPAQ